MKNLFDPLIVGPTIILSGLGIIILSSIAPNLLTSHLIFLFIGAVGFIVATVIDSRVLTVISKHLYVSSLLFLVLPYVVGELTRGTFRWIPLGPVNIQPSELTKPILAICFAKFFSSRSFEKVRDYLWSVVLVALPVGIVFFQPDLGSALVIGFGWGVALVASGIPLRLIAGAIIISGLISPLIFSSLKSYQQSRIVSFLNPGEDPLGAGYNVIQAVVAVGSGQLFGRGLGQGTQSHLRFLPENHTDFVFASLAEEFGLLGILLLLASYAVIVYRSLQIAKITNSKSDHLLILTLIGMFFFQFFVNIGMNMGLLPVTGVPLPLVSYGGSSLISTFISLGILNSIIIRSKSSEAIAIH